MNQYIIIASVVLVIIFAEFLLWRLIKKNLAGKKFWQVVGTLVGMGVGVAATILVVSLLWQPVINGTIWFANNSGLNSIIAGLIISILVVTGIWVALFFVIAFLEPVIPKTSLIVKLMKLLAGFLSLVAIISFSGIAGQTSPTWLWSWRIFLLLFFLIGGTIFFRYIARIWFPDKQKNFGVPITYIITTLAIWWFTASFGWSIFSGIVGSMYSLSAFLIFNFGIFWMSFGMGDPTKGMKSRISWWFVMPYATATLLVALYVVFLQTTGYLTWPEMESARITNQGRQTISIAKREKILAPIYDYEKKRVEALDAGNIAEAEKYQRLIEEQNRLQKQEVRPRLDMPEAVESTVVFIQKKLEKKPPLYPKITETAEYKLVEYSANYWEVECKTDQPVRLTEWLTGRSILFSNFQYGELYECDLQGRRVSPLQLNNSIRAESSNPLIIQAVKGGTKFTMQWS